MKKILGLDLGTNSIGWALIEEGQTLLDGGVVIFPKGNNEDPKSGKESSFAQMRTQYRSARRLLFRRKLRRERILSLAREQFGLGPQEIFEDCSPLSLYKLRAEALDRQLSAAELFRIALFFAKKRGFRSSRKESMRENNKELGVVKQGISELETAIKDSGSRSLGEYYYKLISAHFKGERLSERILQKWTSRQMYIDEFDAIQKTQLAFKNTDFTEKLFSDIKREAFYQRNLKSAKHLIGKCKLEPSKNCMPRSHPVFQEFRALQNINNLYWANPDTAEMDYLTLNQKERLLEYLKSETKPTEAKIKKKIGLSSRTVFNDIELKSCSTEVQFNNLFEKHHMNLPSRELILKIYHSLLHTTDDSYEMFKYFLKIKFDLNEEIGSDLWNLILEPDYSSISHKAAIKLIPHMLKGMRYDQACIEAGYHHSYETKFKNTDRIKSLKTNELRNPVVQKAVSICINLVNKIIDKHGKPDEVRIELARELKKPKKQREAIRLQNFKKQQKRDQYRDVLERHFGKEKAYSSSLLNKYELWLELGCNSSDLHDFDAFSKEVKKSDLEKYQLWLEADRISPYTGNVISLSSLLSGEIEIEHILPFSRCLDNSFSNKTLSERHINAKKGNLTPIEFFKNRPDSELERFKKQIALFSNPFKRSMFLAEELPDSFSNNQLTDTAYISGLAVVKISECIQKVYATKGGVTALLRKGLGLNSILHYEGSGDEIAEFKNRGDHRHHFIDAAVIAATTTGITQHISKESGKGRSLDEIEIPAPWNGFRTELELMAAKILVVHRFPKKLIRNAINPYKHSRSSEKKAIIQKSIRGSMHEDSNYGKIQNPYTGEFNFVIRKELASLNEKQLEKIVDQGIKLFLQKEIEKAGSWSEVLKQGELLFNGKPIRKVRWINSSTDLPELRSSTRTFVESGNNYVLCIYGSHSGKRDYKSVSFYEASQNSLNKNLIYPKQLGDKALMFTITHYDKFILYNNHPEEIDWTNKERLNDSLYHLIKFSGNNIFLGKSIFSKILADKDKFPIKLQCNTNTLKAVKVKLNILGDIIWSSDIGAIEKA